MVIACRIIDGHVAHNFDLRLRQQLPAGSSRAVGANLHAVDFQTRAQGQLEYFPFVSGNRDVQRRRLGRNRVIRKDLHHGRDLPHDQAGRGRDRAALETGNSTRGNLGQRNLIVPHRSRGRRGQVDLELGGIVGNGEDPRGERPVRVARNRLSDACHPSRLGKASVDLAKMHVNPNLSGIHILALEPPSEQVGGPRANRYRLTPTSPTLRQVLRNIHPGAGGAEPVASGLVQREANAVFAFRRARGTPCVGQRATFFETAVDHQVRQRLRGNPDLAQLFEGQVVGKIDVVAGG